MNTRKNGRAVLGGAALAASLVMGGGCVYKGWTSADYEQTVSLTGEHDPEHGLLVRTENGSITVSRGELPGVSVTADVRAQTQERADAVTIRMERYGDTLRIEPDWPDGKRLNGEGVTLRIQVAGSSSTDLRSSNGALKVQGLGGSVEAQSSNGPITVFDHGGPVRLRTSNGRIEVIGARDAVDVGTSNGRVKIELADAADGPVLVRTSNGSVTIDLGDGIAGGITATTSNGSVSLMGPGTSLVGDKLGQMMFAEPGPESTVRTSNGSVSIVTGDASAQMKTDKQARKTMSERPGSDV
ncbi:MAG: hypothetical protein AAGG07_11950 [Planctomycetota bacterium]